MLNVGIAAILLISNVVLCVRATCVSIEDGDDKTSVIASCTFMNLMSIPAELPADSVLGLDVSNNQIKVLHNDSFVRYVNLRTLTLSYNEIKSVEHDAFSGLQQLGEVDLSYNDLEYIDPETFSDNPKLESLSLAGNPLVFFPMDSPAIISTSLISLDLNSCSLTSVNTVTFSRLPNLINLDLSSNHMKVIDRKFLEALESLRIVQLGNNRWDCSCDVKEVMQWASSLRAQPYLQRPIKCFERGHYKTLWSQAKGEAPCKLKSTRGVSGESVWYKVSESMRSRPYNKTNFVLAFMILPCVLTVCALVFLITIKCMDRRLAEDKVILYKHIQE